MDNREYCKRIVEEIEGYAAGKVVNDDGGDIIAVNETFVDMFADCNIADTWTGAGRWNTPLVKISDGFMLVMFPIRVDREYFEIWKEV